jgi:ABC-type polysaccharide/polyol phosphate export permease
MRYRRSFIGFLWTVLAPLINYLLIALVFIYAIGKSDPNFFPYFFTGSIIFNVFSITLQRAPGIMLVNEMYIKKIYLPKIIYVLNTCSYELTNFILTSMTLLAVGFLFEKMSLSWALFIIPANLILVVLSLLGLSCLLSIAGVFFRDLLYIVPQAMQALFFLTPIIYKAEVFPPWIQQIMQMNPLYHMVEIFRAPIVDGQLASSQHYMHAFIFSILSFSIGYMFIKKFDNRIVFKL